MPQETQARSHREEKERNLIFMTDWCKIKMSVIGHPNDVRAFSKKAHAKDLLWKDGKGPAHLGKIDVPLSFHALCPLRSSTLEGPCDPVGIEEEMLQWGCKWGAFESEFEMVEEGHALYTFETANRPPSNLLITCSGDFDVKFYLSYYSNVGTGRRGRAIFFHHETYALMNNASPLSQGKKEDRENFSLRQRLWLIEFYEDHLEWVKGMTNNG